MDLLSPGIPSPTSSPRASSWTGRGLEMQNEPPFAFCWSKACLSPEGSVCLSLPGTHLGQGEKLGRLGCLVICFPGHLSTRQGNINEKMAEKPREGWGRTTSRHVKNLTNDNRKEKS